MSPANGHANDSGNISCTGAQQLGTRPSAITMASGVTPATKIKDLIASLEIPFHPSMFEWRVTNTSKSGPPRGQVMTYADQRAYTDRLNMLVTPAGWALATQFIPVRTLRGVKTRRSSRKCWSDVN